MQLTNTEQFNTARDRVSVARQFEMDMRRARTAQHAGLIVRQMVDRVEPELLPFALPCLSRNRTRYIKRHVRQAIARRLYKAPASVAPFPAERLAAAALAELNVARAELALLEGGVS